LMNQYNNEVRRRKECNSMKKELADYILKLNEAAQRTKRAEDRPLYERYLYRVLQ